MLSSDYTTIDNHKAVDIKSRSLHSSVGSSATMISRIFTTVHNKKNYLLGFAAEQNMYANLEGIMLASARTFVFEDGYDQSATVEDKKKDDVFAIETNKGSISRGKYHTSSCIFVEIMKPEFLIRFQNKQLAQNAGFIPCKVCKP